MVSYGVLWCPIVSCGNQMYRRNIMNPGQLGLWFSRPESTRPDQLGLCRCNLIIEAAQFSFYSCVETVSRFTETDPIVRNQHSLVFQIPTASKDAYQKSFFPQTIRDWNVLPDSLISSAELSDDCVSKFTSLVRARD